MPGEVAGDRHHPDLSSARGAAAHGFTARTASAGSRHAAALGPAYVCVLTCRCSSPRVASYHSFLESYNSTCNDQLFFFLYGHPKGYLLKPVVYWLCHGLLEVRNPFQGICKMSLRKATSYMQYNSLGVCVFCTSDL